MIHSDPNLEDYFYQCHRCCQLFSEEEMEGEICYVCDEEHDNRTQAQKNSDIHNFGEER